MWADGALLLASFHRSALPASNRSWSPRDLEKDQAAESLNTGPWLFLPPPVQTITCNKTVAIRWPTQSFQRQHGACPLCSHSPQCWLSRPLNRKRWHLYRWIEGIERTKPALLFRYAASQTIASVLSSGFANSSSLQASPTQFPFHPVTTRETCLWQIAPTASDVVSWLPHRLRSQINGKYS